MSAPSPTAAPTAAAAVTVTDRALAPDLARGAMLLLICLANVSVYLVGPAGYRGKPAAESMSALDRVVAVLELALVDGRAFPLFGLLVGYGAWQLASRRLEQGVQPRVVARLLRRRALALVLIGALHGVLLFAGDIAAAYGLLLLCFAGAVVRGARSLVVWSVVGVVLVASMGALIALQPPGDDGSTALLMSVASESALTALGSRPVEFLLIGVLGNLFAVTGVIGVGVLAARRRLLDDPARHELLLRAVATAGLSAAVLGGLPLGLVAAGYVEAGTGTVMLLGTLHSVTGYLGGAGYAAVAGLVVVALQRSTGAAPAAAADRPVPLPVRVLGALGRRSLTGYLLHSVVFVAVLPLWTLGWGDDLGLAQAALLGVATWALMLAAAWAMERAGGRGPAEVLLRRLTYGRRRDPSPRG